eukprot:s526_g8.t5
MLLRGTWPTFWFEPPGRCDWFTANTDMDRCRNFFCVVGLMAFCLASHAFVSGRFGSDRKPAKTGYEVQRGNAAKLFDDASDLLWSATGQALSVGAALGMVFAVTQASVRAEEMKAFGDLESQVTVARIDKTKKVTELKADAKKVDEFTKNKVRTSEEKFREFTKDLDTEFASTERSLRAGPGVRSVVRKSLQKEKPSGLSFTGFEGLPSLPALPALPSISLPGLINEPWTVQEGGTIFVAGGRWFWWSSSL